MPRKKNVVASADATVEPVSSALVNRSASAATMDWEFAAPDVPPRIAEMDDPLKQRAVETWRAAHTIHAVVDRWQQWFRDLREHGDADPVIATRGRGILQQSLDCLCGNIEAHRRDSIRQIASHLPQTPSGRLAGKDLNWSTEKNAWVEVEHPSWQNEPELWNSYLAYKANLNLLYGIADELLRMLKRFPARVLDREWKDADTPIEHSPTAEATADGGGTDNPTSRSDTQKKSQKSSKPRMPDAHCKACIKEFKEYRRTGEPRSMRDIVRDYVAQNKEVSETGLYRRLNDNSVQWKPNTR